MADKVNWDWVEKWKKEGDFKIIWEPYGLPEIVDAFTSKYGDIECQPKWDIPDKVLITQSICGSFYSKKSNPNHPITPEEIYKSARECAAEGAASIHIHVRDENGYNVLSPEILHQVIDPFEADEARTDV